MCWGRASASAPEGWGRSGWEGEGARTSLVAASFRFGVEARTPLFERLPPLIHITADDPVTAGSLAPTVQLLISESASNSPGATVIMSRPRTSCWFRRCGRTSREGSARSTGCGRWSDPQIGKALALLHERPAEPWTVESLAAAVALSRSGFAARFTALVGEPPLEYLARWRMTKAAQLLRESHVPLITVAEHVGYKSEASFNRAFKRWGGTAPGTYRREQRQH